MAKRPRRPRDPNQLAALIVGIASGDVHDEPPAASSLMGELGRAGGLKGGRARADAMTPERRAEVARQAAAARWKK